MHDLKERGGNLLIISPLELSKFRHIYYLFGRGGKGKEKKGKGGIFDL
jgi:hypothetical protein